MIKERTYLCIDLKSFFASVEAVERNLDPMTSNLIVADPDRGSGAICLAVTPAMRKLGVHNRCRVFEIPKHINYLIAKPRMSLYIQKSCDIYSLYLKYFSKDDIHVYSIDESFIDVTDYLELYHLDGVLVARKLVNEIYQELGLTATAGIGTNLFLAKVALGIISKHHPEGIAFLDETAFKEQLWHHQPLSDFWMIGSGIMKRLHKHQAKTLYEVTKLDPLILKKEFGINYEILLDHAWGKEPTTMSEIKHYKSQEKSISNGQILFEPYSYEAAKLIISEMVDLLSLELVDKHLVAGVIGLGIGYFKNEIKWTGGSMKLDNQTNVFSLLNQAFIELYERTTNKEYQIKQIMVNLGALQDEAKETLDIFSDYEAVDKERQVERAINDIKLRYGKNVITRGISGHQKGTQKARNKLIGGHNAK
ncbi:MAG: DNA repair protein [Erysipelotrichaceae bacterium]|jgi:DNA polymerase V|nr:DNA repair protein [Erysipelotrichaceae bacterium]